MYLRIKNNLARVFLFMKQQLAYMQRRDFFEKLENPERESYEETISFQKEKLNRAETLIATIADYIMNQGNPADPIQNEVCISVQKYFRIEVEVAKSRLAKLQNARH
jgi:predicted AlkP superfamily pyrophosphatase or phosphodiesterase